MKETGVISTCLLVFLANSYSFNLPYSEPNVPFPKVYDLLAWAAKYVFLQSSIALCLPSKKKLPSIERI